MNTQNFAISFLFFCSKADNGLRIAIDSREHIDRIFILYQLTSDDEIPQREAGRGGLLWLTERDLKGAASRGHRFLPLYSFLRYAPVLIPPC